MQVSPLAASFPRAASLLGLGALSLLGLAAARPAAAQSYTYTPITNDDLGTPNLPASDDPFSFATGITNAGVIVGVVAVGPSVIYGPNPNYAQSEAYQYDTNTGASTLLNYQSANDGSAFTAVSGDGSYLLGGYGDTTQSHFTDSNGHISALPDPYALTGTDPTMPDAIAQYTGINSSGTTVGNSYVGNGDNGQSFIRRADGTLTTFLDTNDIYGHTFAYGINSSGTASGFYFDSSTSARVGFLRSADGTFTDIKVPGATNTYLFGLSDNGNLFGTYTVYDAAGNLVKSDNFTDVGGVFDTSVDIPGAPLTGIDGINDAGQISGYYQDANQTYHSFYGDFNPVPEASSVVSFGLLLAFGLGGVIVAARKKKAAAA